MTMPLPLLTLVHAWVGLVLTRFQKKKKQLQQLQLQLQQLQLQLQQLQLPS